MTRIGTLVSPFFFGIFRENRPTSLWVRLTSLSAGDFLLLVQKKVTKEKDTLAAAVCRASMPGKLREQAEGFADSTSMC